MAHASSSSTTLMVDSSEEPAWQRGVSEASTAASAASQLDTKRPSKDLGALTGGEGTGSRCLGGARLPRATEACVEPESGTVLPALMLVMVWVLAATLALSSLGIHIPASVSSA